MYSRQQNLFNSIRLKINECFVEINVIMIQICTNNNYHLTIILMPYF